MWTFLKKIPEYDPSIVCSQKEQIHHVRRLLDILKGLVPVLEGQENSPMTLSMKSLWLSPQEHGYKNATVMWPGAHGRFRKQMTPGGATELMESIRQRGISGPHSQGH